MTEEYCGNLDLKAETEKLIESEHARIEEINHEMQKL
jgi:hypothetical protein